MWRREFEGFFFDLCDDLVDLVDAPPIGSGPVRPLRPVDGPEVAIGIRPALIPDRRRRAPAAASGHSSRPRRNQSEFVDDRFRVGSFLRGEEGKFFAQIEPRLRAKRASVSSGAGAVALEFAVVEDEAEELVVFVHAGKNQAIRRLCRFSQIEKQRDSSVFQKLLVLLSAIIHVICG